MHVSTGTAALRPAFPADAVTAAAFVQRHQRGLWRFLRAIGCPAHAADEVAQDALLVALARSVADDGRAAGFLRRTARFLWLRQQRDDARRLAAVAAAAEAAWRRDGAADDGDGWLEALRACTAALPERSRHALERFYGEGRSRAELAQELGIGEHGVRTLLQRLRRALHDCVTRRRRT